MHLTSHPQSISAYVISALGLCVKRSKHLDYAEQAPVFPYGMATDFSRTQYSGSESPTSREDSPRDETHESLLFDRWRDGMLSQYFRIQDAIPNILWHTASQNIGCDGLLGKEYILENAMKNGLLITCVFHVEGAVEGPRLNEAVRKAFKSLVPVSILFCDGTPWGDYEIRIVVRSSEEMDDVIELLEEEASNGCAITLIPAMVEFLSEFDGHLRLRLDRPRVARRTMVMIDENSQSFDTLNTVFGASDDGTPRRGTCVTLFDDDSSPDTAIDRTPQYAVAEIQT